LRMTVGWEGDLTANGQYLTATRPRAHSVTEKHFGCGPQAALGPLEVIHHVPGPEEALHKNPSSR
jgi:hypothetical protein